MHRRILALAPLAAFAALVGCASPPPPTTAMLTYETSPEGAELFEGGKSLGMAPVTRSYKGDGKSPTVQTPDVTAVWPSGAKAVFFTHLPLGADNTATIERPKGAPGLQTDIDHGKKVALTRERDTQREKEARAREQARASARCKEQMARRTAGIDDCN